MDTDRDHCCKVGSLADEYDVEAEVDGLVSKWQDGTSIRELTKLVNEAIVTATLDASDASHVEWRHVPIYEALRTDELSESEAIEIRRSLERTDIEVDELESAFVSHQTIYRHLTDCLDASAEAELTDDERREKARDTIYSLQRRTELVTESTVDSLQSAGVTRLGDPDVVVDVQVTCRTCGKSMDVETALTEPCDCETA